VFVVFALHVRVVSTSFEKRSIVMIRRLSLRAKHVVTIGVCALSVAVGGWLRAEEEPKWEPPKPNKEHQALKMDVGVWDAKVKMWQKPDGQAMESKGTETNEMLGDFWLISKFEGEFGGMPFVGGGAFGFDPVKQKFVGIWIDTMSPHQMTITGQYDEETQTLTQIGEGYDHMQQKPCTTKMISRHNDDGTRVMEMYRVEDDGKKWKVMEINYTRRKS
jgi:hypothetical protein